jgi:hypothetical protein
MTNVEGGAVQSGGPTRDRTLGASPLTMRIYRAVLNADQPITAAEIYRQIKDVPGFRTDTSLWWQKKVGSRKKATPPFSAADVGLARVKDRIHHLVKDGVLVSEGDAGRGAQKLYKPGRPPKGHRRHLHPGERFGWYDVDIAADDQRLADRQALYELRNQIQAELAKPRLTARLRQLLSEADRLLVKVRL